MDGQEPGAGATVPAVPAAAADAPAAEQAGPRLPAPPATGDPAVDTALQALVEAAGRPLEEQVTGYEEVHRVLQDRLADVEG